MWRQANSFQCKNYKACPDLLYNGYLRGLRDSKTTFRIVFGSPVPGLEKDRDWTGLRPARTGNHRTAQDRNRSPVCGPLPFREFQDWSKTSLDQSGPVF